MVESVFDRSERSGHQKKASHFQQLKKRHVQYFVHQCTEIAGFIKTRPRGPGEAQYGGRREADRVAEGSFCSPGKSFCNRFGILALSGGRWGSTATQKTKLFSYLGRHCVAQARPREPRRRKQPQKYGQRNAKATKQQLKSE